MQLIQLYIQKEAVRDTVDELGKLGVVQFRDLNPDVNAFQRSFVNEIKRFDEMERRVRFFQEQLKKADENGSLPTVVKVHSEHEHHHHQSSKVMIDELEAKLEEYEKDLLEMNSSQEILDRNFNELIELKYVLEKDAYFFNEADALDVPQVNEDRQPLLGERAAIGGSLGFITGVIPRDKINGFERVIWRATRGNVFMRNEEIDELIKDPQSGEMVAKNVFIVFFQGERAQEKIKRLCESFGVSLYPCPATQQGRAELRAQVTGRIQDLKSVLLRTKDHSRSVLTRIAENIHTWRELVIKEKAIYHTLNLFNNDLGRKCLIAEAWCPVASTADVQKALQRANERSGALVPSILTVIHTHEQPPTYFLTNKFTTAFQSIVDSYGMARYHEINPAVFTIVTFPFLFGVMFGDLGHGAIMASVAGLLIYFEKQLLASGLSEMTRNVFDGRYLIFMMGCFAMYIGLLYNETFAIAIDAGSSWFYPNATQLASGDFPQCRDAWDGNTACLRNVSEPRYWFGVDPAWKNAANDLTFYNSLKMKLSVILGVTQMTLGIILSALNAVHFKKKYNLYCEFIPQMIFMLGLFGYMCFLIVYKWLIPWTDLYLDPPGNPCASLEPWLHTNQTTLNQSVVVACPTPLIMNIMIQMFLSPGHLSEQYMLYPHQNIVQLILLLLSIASVPVMLFVKPYLLKRDHANKVANKGSYVAVAQHEEEEEEEEEFEFSEVMVHQIIHTIEFVLGAVSNTASYLRLWALSLAHSELAAVFWNMIMLTGLSSTGATGIVLTFVCFAAWAALTVAVLLLMESLSAFLHALRLHWVEFQNKFYMGDGYAFVPFDFNRILQEEEGQL